MADGYLNKCKACTKKDVKRRYYDPTTRQLIVEYERKRAQLPDRKRKVGIYQKTSRKRNRGKFKARQVVSNALRNGKLQRLPCAECGEAKVEAHHLDYRSPSKIVWLCRKHHLIAENKIPF